MLLFSLRLVNGPTLPATPAPLAAVLLGLLTEVAFEPDDPLALPEDPLPVLADPAAVLLTELFLACLVDAVVPLADVAEEVLLLFFVEAFLASPEVG
ncbi:unnamed protein product [Ambrosiozyma monospora]|uniref:Unnamed protein product n=1 Tax=Ambrosiozyma monospora TaxID=43982 RepID=A0ACB5T5Z1_AMBMO|nr:unnamed protein product [Ambrosiozyma monospora]